MLFKFYRTAIEDYKQSGQTDENVWPDFVIGLIRLIGLIGLISLIISISLISQIRLIGPIRLISPISPIG